MRSLVGQTIDGRFVVRGPIGEGAMGSVVAADSDEGIVAVKILKDVDDAMRGPQRFMREIRFLNQLVHPNVVDLIDFGRDEQLGVLYFAMELLHGDPVSRLVAAGRSTPALALTVARQAAEGIVSAHEANIIHRDLKPANLMLVPAPDGRIQVKILDFGLAYVLTEARLTDMGSAPGTVSYMPPEQLRGEPVDHRGDLYGLGVILFEMLTGQKPFPGETQVEIAMAVLQRPAPRVDDLVPEVPAELADLIASLLHKDRGARPQSAGEFIDHVAAFQRTTNLRPPTVSHLGPSRDPRSQWDLRDPLPAQLIR